MIFICVCIYIMIFICVICIYIYSQLVNYLFNQLFGIRYMYVCLKIGYAQKMFSFEREENEPLDFGGTPFSDKPICWDCVAGAHW